MLQVVAVAQELLAVVEQGRPVFAVAQGHRVFVALELPVSVDLVGVLLVLAVLVVVHLVFVGQGHPVSVALVHQV